MASQNSQLPKTSFRALRKVPSHGRLQLLAHTTCHHVLQFMQLSPPGIFVPSSCFYSLGTAMPQPIAAGAAKTPILKLTTGNGHG